MLSAYRSFITEKDGCKMIGQPVSYFRELLKQNTIESSYRNGKTLYIHEYSLSNYIEKFGGKKERLRESIIDKIRDYQHKYISLIVKGNTNIKLKYSYSHQHLKQLSKVYTEYKKNKKTIEVLNGIGFTDKLLEDNYGTGDIDVGFFKAKKSDDPKFKIRHFFNTYLQTKKDYETNFNYYLSYTVIKSIILKSRKEFS